MAIPSPAASIHCAFFSWKWIQPPWMSMFTQPNGKSASETAWASSRPSPPSSKNACAPRPPQHRAPPPTRPPATPPARQDSSGNRGANVNLAKECTRFPVNQPPPPPPSGSAPCLSNRRCPCLRPHIHPAPPRSHRPHHLHRWPPRPCLLTGRQRPPLPCLPHPPQLRSLAPIQPLDRPRTTIPLASNQPPPPAAPPPSS